MLRYYKLINKVHDRFLKYVKAKFKTLIMLKLISNYSKRKIY